MSNDRKVLVCPPVVHVLIPLQRTVKGKIFPGGNILYFEWGCGLLWVYDILLLQGSYIICIVCGEPPMFFCRPTFQSKFLLLVVQAVTVGL